MNEGQSKVDIREKVPSKRKAKFNALEHVLKGSSTNINGVNVNYSELIRQVNEGKLGREILVLQGVKKKLTVEEALSLEYERESQFDEVGTSFGFLNVEKQHELSKMGYQIAFKPIGAVHPDSRVADPLWKIAVVDVRDPKNPKEIADEAAGNLIELNEFYNEYLQLSPSLNPGSRILHFTALQEKHDL